jgi:hypothetical protein
MIKFFRKIRQNSLMENKTGKYLKYAIGEIILVVIGILLALKINNWNESQKHEAKLLNYLTNLREALIDDIASLKSNISYIPYVCLLKMSSSHIVWNKFFSQSGYYHDSQGTWLDKKQ